MCLNSSMFWNERATPRRAIRLGRVRVSSWVPVAVVQHDRPLLGPVEAADAVEQARLAGAVGADHGVDVALVDLERDVLERAHPAEA